jgi:hypothetical protein
LGRGGGGDGDGGGARIEGLLDPQFRVELHVASPLSPSIIHFVSYVPNNACTINGPFIDFSLEQAKQSPFRDAARRRLWPCSDKIKRKLALRWQTFGCENCPSKKNPADEDLISLSLGKPNNRRVKLNFSQTSFSQFKQPSAPADTSVQLPPPPAAVDQRRGRRRGRGNRGGGGGQIHAAPNERQPRDPAPVHEAVRHPGTRGRCCCLPRRSRGWSHPGSMPGTRRAGSGTPPPPRDDGGELKKSKRDVTKYQLDYEH